MCRKLTEDERVERNERKRERLRLLYIANAELYRARAAKRYVEKREEIRARARHLRAINPEKERASARRWAAANSARVLARVISWAAANVDKVRATKKRWVVKHAEKDRAAKRRYKKEHPEKVREYTNQRRARKRGARGVCSAVQTAARIAYYGGNCAYCRILPYEHIDHVIPLSRGGSNWPANLRPSCAKCNLSKGGKLLSEWSQ